MNTILEMPAGLDADERECYTTLLRVKAHRDKTNIAPPNILVITDIPKDTDDPLCFVALGMLKHLGLVKVVGAIANVKPAKKRANFLREWLDSLGLKDVPIGWGEEATTKSMKEHPHEFASEFMDENITFTPYGQPKEDPGNFAEIESGISLLERLVKSIVETPDGKPREPKPEEKLTILNISSLADIWTFAKSQPEKLARATARMVLQGSYTVEHDPSNSSLTLIADLQANNNGYDTDSAVNFHKFMQDYQISSVVVTKVAATASALPRKILDDMAATGHKTGNYLRKVHEHLSQFYFDASGDPETRHMTHMDKFWFLSTRTDWFVTHNKDETYPDREEVLKYVRVVPYDAIAGLEAAGSDIREALKIFKPFEDQSIHRVVGKRDPDPEANDPGDIGINIKETQIALKTLWKGSLTVSQSRETNGLGGTTRQLEREIYGLKRALSKLNERLDKVDASTAEIKGGEVRSKRVRIDLNEKEGDNGRE